MHGAAHRLADRASAPSERATKGNAEEPLRRGRLRFLGGAAVNLEGTRDTDTRGREIVNLKLARAEIRACSRFACRSVALKRGRE